VQADELTARDERRRLSNKRRSNQGRITRADGRRCYSLRHDTPYYAGRDNYFGTCGSHAATQYVETLLARYSDDLAIKRVIYVNNEPVVVPEPRVALSPSAGLAQLYTWDGTHVGDPPNNSGPPSGTAAFPNFPEAYWLARENQFQRWADTAGQVVTPKCEPDSFWTSGFCIGQGHPGPGVYRSHSLQVQNLDGDPLSDPPWSLANAYFNFVARSIPLDNKDAAVQAVIAEIRSGLPVLLSFPARPGKATPDGNGGTLTYFDGTSTWYLPPELACDNQTLDAIFAPDDGHMVNIVGYWISGTAASPDPFSSYFILQNNWGKTAGYRSFYFMSFAAFGYLANGLMTYRLDRACWSVACAHKPSADFPRALLDEVLFPPDPGSTISAAYNATIAATREILAGSARLTSDFANPAIHSERLEARVK
jgi:hypothetical protein